MSDYQQHTKNLLGKTLRFDSLETLNEQLKGVKLDEKNCQGDKAKLIDLERERVRLQQKIQKKASEE